MWREAYYASRITYIGASYRDPKQVHAGHLLMARSLLRIHQKIALASRVVVSVVLRVEVRVRFVPQGPLAALFEAARKEGVQEDGTLELPKVRRTVLNLDRSRER